MAAPVKPWEGGGALNNQARASMDPPISSTVGANIPVASVTTEIQGAGRPPVPPRLDSNVMSTPTGMMYPSYGAGFGGYSNMYSSPYSSYASGGYGYSPYNRMPYNGMQSSNFVQAAETSAQGAFQSVESVVSAVSSISMMLESTYMALHNSFRAVLGVADQFSKVKVQLSQMAATFAVFRILRWLYRRLLVLLGLRKAGLSDDAWANALKKSAEEAQQRFPAENKSTWPIILFFTITFGGPYLIWRMLSNMSGCNHSKGWADGTTDHVVAESKFDYTGEREDELTMTTGQRINLAPADMQPRLRQNDWLLGSVDGEKVGFIPASYVRILGTRKGKPKVKLSELQSHPDSANLHRPS